MASTMGNSNSHTDADSPITSRIVIALDATRDHPEQEIKQTINEIRAQVGYQMEAEPLSIFGTHKCEIEKEVTKKVDAYVNMLMQSAQDCEGEGVDIEVKITAGTPVRKVVVQEVTTINATCVVLDSCGSALSSNFEGSYSFSGLNPTLHSGESPFAVWIPSQHRSARGDMKHSIPPIFQKERRPPTSWRSSNTPFLCIDCGAKTELYIKDSMKFSFSEIQLATDDFSKDNLLGEADTVINIVMLLGYCCKENVNIMVYEYICNNSLKWHLFKNVLEWHRRYAIAIGTAKGLRCLHEECRGGPIIHRDLRPSDILLTHDYVPMLGDFGLAKWKTNEDKIYTRILGTLGYLAPEYAENGIVSVRTDVYAFGIVLILLLSGRKSIDSMREDSHHSLRQWPIPLIERLALHELIDPRIGDSYDTFEVYHMSRTAFLCVQNDPELRPSMGEVLRLLQGELDHLHQIAEQFVPQFVPHFSD
ncbi:hypothetical protein RND71_028116 [Anisodus tanguticus]|uniref:Protein kinase domain-containing protein n=1 Tax=Anisodus tanguticus TaxID=243964 RepID=A0AAE1V1A7_9SOLA|nr:hypothetical protein RND71_028116 [Anisodus tanguticus]